MESVFLRACRGRAASTHVPVWFMRQAGRSLPEYRALRGTGSILDAIADPRARLRGHAPAGAPLRRRRRDPLLRHRRAVPRDRLRRRRRARVAGRWSSEPFASAARPRAPARPRAEATSPTSRATVELVVERARGGDTPLIGFAGAPFTVASYLVEGGPTRDFARVKALMHADPALFDALTRPPGRDSRSPSCDAQVGARRARASSSSTRGPGRSRATSTRASPCPRRATCSPASPTSACRPSSSAWAPASSSASWPRSGADVMGIDWRVDLDEARRRVGALAVQGNLDPARCAGSASTWRWPAAREVLARAGHRAGPRLQPRPRRAARRPTRRCSTRSSRVVHDEGRAGVSRERPASWSWPTARRRPATTSRRTTRGSATAAPRPPEQLADLVRRYDAIGGTSPLAQRTRRPGGGPRRARSRRARPRPLTTCASGRSTSRRCIEDGRRVLRRRGLRPASSASPSRRTRASMSTGPVHGARPRGARRPRRARRGRRVVGRPGVPRAASPVASPTPSRACPTSAAPRPWSSSPRTRCPSAILAAGDTLPRAARASADARGAPGRGRRRYDVCWQSRRAHDRRLARPRHPRGAARRCDRSAVHRRRRRARSASSRTTSRSSTTSTSRRSASPREVGRRLRAHGVAQRRPRLHRGARRRRRATPTRWRAPRSSSSAAASPGWRRPTS